MKIIDFTCKGVKMQFVWQGCSFVVRCKADSVSILAYGHTQAHRMCVNISSCGFQFEPYCVNDVKRAIARVLTCKGFLAHECNIDWFVTERLFIPQFTCHDCLGIGLI